MVQEIYKLIKDLNIEVCDKLGRHKSWFDILKELSDMWDSLSDKQIETIQNMQMKQ